VSPRSLFRGTALARGECNGQLRWADDVVTGGENILLVEDLSSVPDLGDAIGYLTKWAGTTTHRVLDARAQGRPVVRLAPDDFDELAGYVASSVAEWRSAHIFAGASDAHVLSTAALPSITGPVEEDRGVARYANVDDAAHCQQAIARGAKGVGMWRLERFLTRTASKDIVRGLLAENDAPPKRNRIEEVAEMIAEELAEMVRCSPGFVCLRLVDASPCDFGVAPLPGGRQLGLRGIRLSLTHTALLDAQLLALGMVRSEKTRLLLPLVSHEAELDFVRRRLNIVTGDSFARKVPIGYTLESPRSVVMLQSLGAQVDFVSIGTNDLVQFFWAADRDYSEASWIDSYRLSGIKMPNPYREVDQLLLTSLLQPVLQAAKVSRPSLEIGMSGDYARLNLAVDLLSPPGLDYVSLSLADL
jgi:hypothetical protein